MCLVGLGSSDPQLAPGRVSLWFLLESGEGNNNCGCMKVEVAIEKENIP